MMDKGKCCMLALATLFNVTGGPSAARDCSARMIEVLDVREGTLLASLPAQPFSLLWRNSVTLGMVQADYILGLHGQIIQVAERFAAHGPGMAHDGAGWRIEGGQMVVDLNRDIPRLILRTATAYENRLIAGDITLDLTQWPATPLEILSPDCKESPQ